MSPALYGGTHPRTIITYHHARYDPCVQSVGLFEAWGLWWQGQKLDGMALYGVPILIIGRIGKVMAFVGSVVTVIDIIGPARIREWGGRAKNFDEARFGDRWRRRPALIAVTYLLMIPVGLGINWFALNSLIEFRAGSASLGEVIANVALVFIPGMLISFIFESATRAIGRVLENEAWERALRWSGLTLIIIGFSFDLLAS